MENRNLVFLILVSVILFVIASMTIPVLQKSPQEAQDTSSPRPGEGQGRQAGGPAVPGQEEAKQLKTAVSFMNIGLIIPLFVIYAGIYRRMKTSFTLGLMAVIFTLGMYAVTANPLITGLLGGRSGDIGPFQILPDLCTTAALVILIRISLE